MCKQFLDDYRMENGLVQSYAFPGGYPIYYVARDNGVLCPKCVNENLGLCTDPEDNDPRSQWIVNMADLNYEDSFLYCDNCSQLIEAPILKMRN